MPVSDDITPLIREASVASLLRMQREIRLMLKEHGVVRTNNQAVADYAEWLVWKLEDGSTLEPNSKKTWDVATKDGLRIQVKARQLTPENPSRQLSQLRSWEFDKLAVILFDEWGTVTRAVYLDPARAKTRARVSGHVNAWIVVADDRLLAHGDDMTAKVLKLVESA